MRKPKAKTRLQPASSSGFTLVEMLVSVTLVLLMMTMFAAVFQIATESVSTQRAISENDQRVRSLTTVLRADVQKRTFRRVQPFFPSEDPNNPNAPTSFGHRQGYFYISTNRADVGLDDVLQFTVSVDQLQQNTDTTPYFGRVSQLADRTRGNLTGLTIIPNQPELDDGSLDVNSTGASPAAEVSYFVRNGNLYRRVLLLRQPLALGGADLGPQPSATWIDSSATPPQKEVDLLGGYTDRDDIPGTYDGNYVTASGTRNDFWTDFDLSATPKPAYTGAPPAAIVAGVSGVNMLSNVPLGGPGLESCVGQPRFRFGFNFLNGVSREHASLGGPFIGRYLQAETSAGNFNYPQQLSTVFGSTALLPQTDGSPNGNPMDLDVPLVLNDFGIVTAFDEAAGLAPAVSQGRGGPRAVEDLLLANVHEFKIEVWDERLGRYVPPGHNFVSPVNGPGDYHRNRRFNPAYGPQDDSLAPLRPNAVFDTWHHDADADGDPTTEVMPPFLPMTWFPLESPPNGPTPPAVPAADRKVFWEPNTVYTPRSVNAANPSIVFPQWTDDNGDSIFQWGEYNLPTPHSRFQRAYLCVHGEDNVVVNGALESGTAPPNWPTTPGRQFTDGELTWEVIDNTRPLKSIRIKLRFVNSKSETMRQMTLILSLVDESN